MAATKPTLTIGFPTYDDYSGIELTLQSLALYHDLADVELIVVDNHPTADEKNPKSASKETAKLARYVTGMGGKYVALANPVGTAAPRDKIFEVATGEVVIVSDGHVMFGPHLLPAVRDYFADPIHVRDILTGPILQKVRQPGGGLGVLATHYADVWRSEMWGIWSQAWACGMCRGDWHFDVAARPHADASLAVDAAGRIVAAPPQPKAPFCDFFRVAMGRQPVTACPSCGRELPNDLPHPQHEAALESRGFIRRCWAADDVTPFEIPGLGLGLFAMRREHWPGFAPGMIGFGGGELHMHELVRRNGGRAVCHPLARWWHRFEREKVPYPLELWHKVRNYVLWRQRLNITMEPVYAHFVAGPAAKINDAQWQWLMENPTERTTWPAHLATGRSIVESIAMPDDADFARLAKSKDRAAPHMATIRRLASQASRCVIAGKRPHWLAALPPDRRGEAVAIPAGQSLTAEPTDCDLLILDVDSTAERLRLDLARWAPHCRRWIALYGTESYGEKSEGGKADGLMVAAREFCEANPAWKRVFHDDRTSGLSVFSCDPNERTIDRGPGTELHRLFAEIGIRPTASCGCREMTRRMDAWGVAGCREHETEILDHLRANQDKYGWRAKFSAAAGMVLSGLWLKVGWSDPFPGLLAESIRRAEAEETAWQKQQAAA